MEQDEEDKMSEAEFREINEEYKIWKKYTPYYYDLIQTHVLELPSLTVEWLPHKMEPPGKDFSVHWMILGTHAPENEPNYLILAELLFPLDDSEIEVRYPYNNRLGGYGFAKGAVKVFPKLIRHDGDVNRTRYMPQKSTIVATKTDDAHVFVFDLSNYFGPSARGSNSLDFRLRGHDTGGYGLSWNKLKVGHLLSGSNQICLWDINATPDNKSIDAMQIFTIQESFVEDVDWHRRSEHVFGSVGDDKCLHMWDLRVQSISKPVVSVVAHESEVNCLDFNPFNEWIVLTGSTDKTVKLFDIRKIVTALHTFASHKDEISQVGWSPKNEAVFASSGLDRKLMIWDLSRIGQSLPPKQASDGPPELLFIHGGHTSQVSDFAWNRNEDWTIASVAEDNILQVWQMAENIYYEDFDEEPPDDSTDVSKLTTLLSET